MLKVHYMWEKKQNGKNMQDSKKFLNFFSRVHLFI